MSQEDTHLDSKKVRDCIIHAIKEKHGKRIVAMETGEYSYFDEMIIAEGSVERHLAALRRSVETELASLCKDCPGEKVVVRVDGDPESGWIVMECSTPSTLFCVHLFLDELRNKYQFETKWDDVELQEYSE